jgi:hypothetical protein
MGLPEELFSCALTGKPGPIGDARFLNALAAAVLMELALAKRVDIEPDGEVRVVDHAPTGSRAVDEALADLPAALDAHAAAGRDRTVGSVTPGMVKAAYKGTYDAAVADGWVEVRESKLLGMVSREVLVATARAEGARERARRILLGEEAPDERGSALAGLIEAAGLVDRLVPKPQRSSAKQRAEELSSGDPVPGEIGAAVGRIQNTVRGLTPG